MIQGECERIKEQSARELLVLGVCARIVTEVQDSIRKHGDWADYSLSKMFEAVQDEWLELQIAKDNLDIDGQHGMIRESIQVAAVLVKLIVKLEGRHGL